MEEFKFSSPVFVSHAEYVNIEFHNLSTVEFRGLLLPADNVFIKNITLQGKGSNLFSRFSNVKDELEIEITIRKKA